MVRKGRKNGKKIGKYKKRKRRRRYQNAKSQGRPRHTTLAEV